MTPARWVLVLALLLAAAGAAWFLWPRAGPLPPPPPAAAPPAVAAPSGPRFPVPAAPEAPLPKLGESDPAALEALAALLGSPAMQKLFRTEDVVRRIVATVDNLPREHYAERLLPTWPVGGAFLVRGREGERVVAAENARRYDPHVKLLESVEPSRLVAAYARLYPLFQQAYEELGYPGKYFNDRLVEVIDHLLATPEDPWPARLEAPKALFVYSDPDLEARSAGRKVLMRMGPEHARRVKARLAAIRAELVAMPAKTEPR